MLYKIFFLKNFHTRSIKFKFGASTLSSAIIIAGGGSRSVAIRGSVSAIDTSLFALRGETLELDRIYEVQTLNNNVSLTGNTGLPFGMFDYTTQSSNAGAVGTRLQNQGKYVRHQNLPVRGVMRQRPASNTGQPSQNNSVVDFLLIGGFNSVGNSEYNNTVVSGAFHSLNNRRHGVRFVKMGNFQREARVEKMCRYLWLRPTFSPPEPEVRGRWNRACPCPIGCFSSGSSP